jgi:hypothetical protein
MSVLGNSMSTKGAVKVEMVAEKKRIPKEETVERPGVVVAEVVEAEVAEEERVLQGQHCWMRMDQAGMRSWGDEAEKGHFDVCDVED